MKLVLKLLGALVVLLLLIVVLQVIASESGEVVVVTTQDAEGGQQETRLWVVDADGVAWLRSGSSQAGWFQRMQQNPTVEVVRNEGRFTATVHPDETQRDAVNALMNDKYGWADSYIALLFGRDDAIPLRLDVQR